MNPSMFDPACTAEQLVAAVDAVYSLGSEAKLEVIADFIDVTPNRVESILNLAVAMGLLSLCSNVNVYVTSKISRLLVTASPEQRPAVLRMFLEEFQVFDVFRSRMVLDGTTDAAIRRTKTILKLSEHHGEISQTLISLGTYCGALNRIDGSTDYVVHREIPMQFIGLISQAIEDRSNAESLVIKRIGSQGDWFIECHESVIVPLTAAVVHASRGESDQAVFRAGNALDSFLQAWAKRTFGSKTLTGTGIGSYVNEIAQWDASKMPKKVKAMGFFLSNLRNAADHGTDSEIGEEWSFCDVTGQSYVLVACDFVRVCCTLGDGQGFKI